MAVPKLVAIPNTASVDKWAERISTAWREQVPSIFETGNLLEAAQRELKETQPGGWGVMVKEKLPFNRQTAFKLMKIAECGHLRDENVSPGKHLPANWTILYALTKLTQEQFDAGIKSGVINPKMERKDVNALRGIEPKPKPEKKKERELKTVDDWGGALVVQITAGVASLSPQDLPEFFSRLRDAIDRLESGEYV